MRNIFPIQIFIFLLTLITFIRHHLCARPCAGYVDKTEEQKLVLPSRNSLPIAEGERVQNPLQKEFELELVIAKQQGTDHSRKN